MAGDATLFIGIGALDKVQKGARATRVLAAASKYAKGVEITVAVVQSGRAVYAAIEGDWHNAFAHGGDATLRLLGLSAEQVLAFRAARQAKATVNVRTGVDLSSRILEQGDESATRLIRNTDVSPVATGNFPTLRSWLSSDGAVLGACFSAGTQILVPSGTREIESLRVGELVISRDERNPDSPITARRIEALFRTHAQITTLTIGGKEVRTTAEHPVFVEDRGWTPVSDLKRGDVLVGHDHNRATVDAIATSGSVELVFNLRVSEDHTYFVGGADWLFSVWVHNSYSARQAASGGWEVIDDGGNTLLAGLSQIDAQDLAKVYGNPIAVSGLPRVNKSLGSQMQHAAKQATERLGFSSTAEATEELRILTKQIGDNGFLLGVVPDPGNVIPRTKSYLVPLRGGAAVYSVDKNGVARLHTVLSPLQYLEAIRKQGLL